MAKTKVLILGSTGMLGNAVANHFLRIPDFSAVLTARERVDNFFPGANAVVFDVMKDPIDVLPVGVEYVINCVGTIKPFMAKDPAAARYINGVFPWKLAAWCKEKDAKLFHITTDCVFSGRQGRYTEESLHDALDDYGKSKSLGEPVSECMVLRTSIIGEEIRNHVSLLAWAKSQKGKEINGFINHFWNGVTTDWYAKVCERIIRENRFNTGLYHVFASDIVSKYQMMEYFNEKFGLGMIIKPVMATELCDRSLATVKDFCAKLDIPSVREMVCELQ